jgi:formate dehydrogenase assembly factor FdhD
VSAAVVPVPICTVTGYAISQSDDLLAVEEPLEIRLGKRSLSITMRTPGSDFELAAGFLFSEGLIRDSAEIRSMSRVSAGNPNIVVVELVNEGARGPVIAQRNFAMTSACGLCGKASLQDLAVNICPVIARDAIRIEPEIIHQMAFMLQPSSTSMADWNHCVKISGATMRWTSSSEPPSLITARPCEIHCFWLADEPVLSWCRRRWWLAFLLWPR